MTRHPGATRDTIGRRQRRLAPLALAALAAWSALLGFPAAAEEAPAEAVERTKHHHGDLIHVFTGDVTIPRDTVRHGTVFCVGGDVLVEGEVTDDIVVILGSLTLDGAEVGGDVVGVLSRLDLRDTELRRQLVNVGGDLFHEGVVVGGQQYDFGLLGGWFPGFVTLLTWLRVLGVLFAFILLVLLVTIAPDRVRAIGEETPGRYLTGFFVGVLAYCVLLVILLPLAAVSIVGLPMLYLAYLVAKWLGLAGLFYAIGRGLGRGVGREMSPLGAVLLVYALYALALLAPSPLGLTGLAIVAMVRVMFFCFFEVPGLGLALLTRFGSRSAPVPAAAASQGSGPSRGAGAFAADPGAGPPAGGGPGAPTDPSAGRSD